MKSFFKELFLVFLEIIGLAMLAFLIAGTLANADQLRVAVLDTGLNLKDPRFKDVLCKTGHMDFTGQGLDDFIGHGTHIAGLIKKEAGNSKDYCLIIVKFYNPGAPNKVQDTAYLSALDYATSHAEIVNYSGGSKQGPNSTELLILNINANTIIIAAAGNEGLDLSKVKNGNYYPSGYTNLKNVISVGSLTRDGSRKYEGSNYGIPNMAWEIGEDVWSTYPEWACVVAPFRFGPEGCLWPMTGTSMATAIHTGKTIKKLLQLR